MRVIIYEDEHFSQLLINIWWQFSINISHVLHKIVTIYKFSLQNQKAQGLSGIGIHPPDVPKHEI